MSKPKILTLDIEATPSLVYTWGLFNQNISIGQIVEPTRLLCFSAKWHHERKVMSFSGDDMVEDARALLDTADVVVTYNGDGYDLPHLNREFLEAGLSRPSPYTSVDLYKILKRNTKFLSHKLAWITHRLDLSGKMKHEGFDLWLKCMDGDEKAWRTMIRYCNQDVKTTEELFDASLQYIDNMPALGLFTEDGALRCPKPTCGSFDLVKQGFKRTKTRRYQQYRCNDCGSWFRDTRSDMGVAVTA